MYKRDGYDGGGKDSEASSKGIGRILECDHKLGTRRGFLWRFLGKDQVTERTSGSFHSSSNFSSHEHCVLSLADVSSQYGYRNLSVDVQLQQSTRQVFKLSSSKLPAMYMGKSCWKSRPLQALTNVPHKNMLRTLKIQILNYQIRKLFQCSLLVLHMFWVKTSVIASMVYNN